MSSLVEETEVTRSWKLFRHFRKSGSSKEESQMEAEITDETATEFERWMQDIGEV